MNKKIETSLRQLSHITPSRAFQEDAKRRLFARIQEKESPWVIRLLKNIFKPIPRPEFSEASLHRLLLKIEDVAQESSLSFFQIIKNIFFSPRTLSLALASFVIVVFVVQIPATQADEKTELWVTHGEVEVKSLGTNWETVEQKRVLKIGDKIRTDNNGSADIYFSNNSVVRIDSKTQINFSESIEFDDISAPVILQLQEGRIWSNITAYDQDFFVETKHSRVSTKLGVFDVAANDATIVRSIQNAVNIEPRSTPTEPIFLSAGFETKLHNNGVIDSPQVAQLKTDNWASLNQEKDATLREQIFAEEKENERKIAGTLPGSPLYEMSQVVQAFSGYDFTDIQKKFASSKVLFDIHEKELALQQFNEAKEQLAAYWVAPEQKAEHEAQVLAFLEQEKVFFAQVLTGDSLFDLKKQFQELFVAYAPNPKQEVLNQVNERMLEIQNLVVRNDTEAPVLVAALESFTTEAASLSEETLSQGKEEELQKLLTMQNQNLKVLQELAPTLEDEYLEQQADETRKELVGTIQKIVSKLAPEQPVKPAPTKKQANWFAQQIQTMVQKVSMYETQTGRLNTMHWILQDISDNKSSLGLLYTLRDSMPEDVRLPISKKILTIRQTSR